MNKKGFFISLEGPDGAGKTTQLQRLANKAREVGLCVTCTREPGGTPVSDAVRGMLLDPRYREMTPLTEVFLYAAARSQLYYQVIGPALARGELVLCDRFIDSSLAYQAYGGGIEADFVLQVNLLAVDGRLPDRTYLLDIPSEMGIARNSGCGADRIEQKSLDFHKRVREGFLDIAQRFPDRVTVIDASQPEDNVFTEIWHNVFPLLGPLMGKTAL